LIRNWLSNISIALSSIYGSPLGEVYKSVMASQFWDHDTIQSYQLCALQVLIKHCYKNVPYYYDLMQKRGIKPDDIQQLEDLSIFPFLTREIIRKQGNRLLASNYLNRKIEFRRSGGTTGEPTRVAADARARAYETAAYLRGFKWMGYQIGCPMVRLFGGSLGLDDRKTFRSIIREFMFNSRFLPAFELSRENAVDYVREINRYKGTVLVGYSSVLRNLAEHICQQGLKVGSIESVISTAEPLPEHWRVEISSAIKAPVYSYYGCGEVNSMGYEKPGQVGYIVPQEHIILESTNNKSDVYSPTGRGQACVTTLFNYAMPLIRYLNGDELNLSYFDSGLAHQRILSIEGRVMDQLVASNGEKISGAFVPHLVFKSGFPAWKYQVVQFDRNSIQFHYLPNPNNPVSMEMFSELTKVFKKHLGKDIHVEFSEGDFEQTPAGKHRFVINQLQLEKKDIGQ
jgi:phenylacetate-CoA ligase